MVYGEIMSETYDERWHYIHDFFNSFGFQNQEDKTKFIWLHDVHTLLNYRSFKPDDDTLDEIYEELKEPLAKRNEAIKKWQDEHPFKIPDKMTIPRVHTPWPDPERLRRALYSQPLMQYEPTPEIKEFIDKHVKYDSN